MLVSALLLAIQVATGFVALPPVHIALDSTDVERHIYVEANSAKVVQRLVIEHTERVRPGTSFKFVYPSKPPYTFGGNVYRLGTYVYDEAKEAAAAPTKEAAITRAALQQAGYTVPRLVRVARLARVADADGSSEVIIFYMENADADYPSGALPGADEDGDLVLKGADAASLLQRMNDAISVNP